MDYYRTAPSNPSLLIATLLGALVLSLLFWLAWLWVEWRPSPAKLKLAYCGFLLVLIYPMESVREYWNTENYDLATNLVLVSIEALLGVGVVLVFAGNTRIVRAARRITLMLTLLIPSLVIDFTWSRLNAEPEAAYLPKTPQPALALHGARRVVWVLFDEFDERLAFDLRQPKVDLPELNRLRSESFVATQAAQTAGWTMLAVPSLLSGRIYTRAELVDAATLEVYPEGSTIGSSWGSEPNIFRRARDAGFNSALIGWHHPYCRVLGDSLVQCVDVPSGTPTPALLRETSAAKEGALRSVGSLLRLQVSNLTDMFRPGESTWETAADKYVQKLQQGQYFQIRDLTYGAATDPKINLLFAHFPIPHPFGIYDSRRHDYTLSDSLSYADNLALVDRTVGELRRTLEKAGMWDSTTVVITSDHGLRPDLWRGRSGWNEELERLTGGKQSPLVPFIVKLAEDPRGVVYDQPFSSVIEGDLILAVLQGQVTTTAGIAAWLDQHAPN